MMEDPTPHLRRNKPGHQSPWNDMELMAGLGYFLKLHGHYPSAHEIDNFEYLPSSRSIQRSYGGLQKLRERLLPGQISNYTKGDHRSGIAKRTYSNGRSLEAIFYEYLVSQFKEIAIHEHKLIRPGNVSCDFYIYTAETKGIIIDVFYAASITNLVNIINIKLKRYTLVAEKTYLILMGNDNITQGMIDEKCSRRHIPLPTHGLVVTDLYFRESVIPELLVKSKYALS